MPLPAERLLRVLGLEPSTEFCDRLEGYGSKPIEPRHRVTALLRKDSWILESESTAA